MPSFANVPTNLLFCALSIHNGGRRELAASIA